MGAFLDSARTRLAPLRQTLGPLWWYSLLVFAASRIGDALYLYLGAFYLPKALTPNELGAVDPVTRLAQFGAIPLAVVSAVGAKYLSTYQAQGEWGKLKRFLLDMTVLGLVSAAVFIAILVLTYDAVRIRLNLQAPHLLLGLSALAALSCWQPLIRMMLQGVQRFYVSAAVGLGDVGTRLVLAVLLVPLFHLSGYLFAMFFGGIVAVAGSLWGMRTFIGRRVKAESYYADWRGILGFTWPVAIATVVGSITGFVEPFTIKHFLPETDSAGYYMACRFGYIPTYLTGAVGFVLFPLLSHGHEQGRDTMRHLWQALGVTLAISIVSAIIIGAAARWLLGLMPQWQPYQAYSIYVWRLGLLVTLDSAISIYGVHEMACRRFSYLWVTLPIYLLEAAALYGSFGFGAFRTVLPAGVWEAIYRAIPRTLGYAVWVMIAARAAIVLGLLVHWRLVLAPLAGRRS